MSGYSRWLINRRTATSSSDCISTQPLISTKRSILDINKVRGVGLEPTGFFRITAYQTVRLNQFAYPRYSLNYASEGIETLSLGLQPSDLTI